MSDSTKKLLLAVISIGILAAAFFGVVRPNYEKKEKVDTEIQTLQAKYNDLLQKEQNRQFYEDGIAEYNAMFNDIIAKYPSQLDQEISIMFVQGVREAMGFDATSYQLGEPYEFYQLGAQVVPDGVVADNTTTEAASTEEATEATTEAATEAAVAEATTTNSAYTCMAAQFPMDYEGSYESLKEYVAYVANYKYRMTVDEMTITYDAETDTYSGETLLSAYAVMSEDRDNPDAIELEDVNTGLDNIFTGDGAGTNTSSKYDEDNGAAIENDYDFFIMLNPTTSDVSGKIVGQNGAGKEDTYVSNNDNDVQTVTMTLTKNEEGKYMAAYSIGSAKPKADTGSGIEFDPGEDLNVLVQSTAKVGDDDKNGVKLNIINETDKVVNVKVINDDTASPRFKIASRSGKVKVY